MSPESVRLKIAEVSLATVAPETLPGWAAGALVAGLDTPAMRELAGSPPSEADEARRLLDQAASELGIAVPDLPECRRLLVNQWATQIVAGDLPPEVGARRIWVQSSEARANGEAAPDAWLAFANDASDWDELPDRRSEIRASIVSAAQSLVRDE